MRGGGGRLAEAGSCSAAMCVLSGIPYLLIKVAVGGVFVPVVVFARTALGAAILLPAALPVRAAGRAARALATAAGLRRPGDDRGAVRPDVQRRKAPAQLPGRPADRGGADHRRGHRPAHRRHRAAQPDGARQASSSGSRGVGVLAGPHLGGGSAWPVTEVLLVALGYATGPLIAASARLADVAGAAHDRRLPDPGRGGGCAPAAIATWQARLPSGQVLAALAALGAICTGVRLYHLPGPHPGSRRLAGHDGHLRQPGHRRRRRGRPARRVVHGDDRRVHSR